MSFEYADIFDDLTAHMKWLFSLPKDVCSPAMVSASIRSFHMLYDASMWRLSVPAASTGPDGKIHYSWDKGRHHLELEIIPGEQAEFFYSDRENDKGYWGQLWTVGEPLPEMVVKALELVI